MEASHLFSFDAKHGSLVAGCDEAGRSSFAGPIVAAGVLFDHRDASFKKACYELKDLRDSKALTRARREVLLPLIQKYALKVSVIIESAKTIDSEGLHKTNLRVLHEALQGVARPGAVLLADGFTLPEVRGISVQGIIRGDQSSAAIAAASVVTKVTRDRPMHVLDEHHPGYGFAQHMGYGTKAHRKAIKNLGLTEQHRRSFRGVGLREGPEPPALPETGGSISLRPGLIPV